MSSLISDEGADPLYSIYGLLPDKRVTEKLADVLRGGRAGAFLQRTYPTYRGNHGSS